ncbi:MAG: mechanosensitive ion channel family protein [Clostridia bacterium]|nr:mechanosensitive ion channel family protein [Clostridia bacterium]
MSGKITFIADIKSFFKDLLSIVENHFANIIFGVLIIALFFLFRKWLSKNISAIFAKLFKKNPMIGSGIRTSVQSPLKAFFLILGFYLGAMVIGFSPSVFAAITKVFRICNIVLITWALANFTPFATSLVIKFEDKSNRKSSAVAIKFIANILKVIIIALSCVIIISELGYNISGLITGLGLGGLTFSLAAQSTAANLFAGFSIVSDKPFDVGDYIITPSVEGTVEDITMRSTCVRTVADTVIVMPNSKLVNEPITNCSRMTKRYVDFTIGLTYDAEVRTIEKCISDIEEMLKKDEEVSDDRISVSFAGFAESSQDIRIIYFTKDKAFDKSLKVQEKINYSISEIVRKNGASFAFPSTSVYMENA